MDGSKRRVLRRFLGFVSNRIPLEQAVVATLGGAGLEAQLWHEAGIPAEHGWLIERNRTHSGGLVLAHRYQTTNQLRTFHKVLAGHRKGENRVDAFHLDLCGTFDEKAVANFAPNLPMLLRGEGKCLAITVADARRNMALEHWPKIERYARRLLGAGAEPAFRELVRQQGNLPKKATASIRQFNPEKGAKREFAILVALLAVLERQWGYWVPDSMERYVYVSNYRNASFRMRTYFFHFTRISANPRWTGMFADAWLKSPLYIEKDKDFTSLRAPARPATTGATMKTTSRLAALAKALGGAEEAEYNSLIDIKTRFEGLTSLISGNLPSPTPAKQPGQKPGRKKWADLSDKEQIEWLIDTLELKKRSNGKWENGGWEDHLREHFGYYTKGLGKSLRAALAHTGANKGGKFRTQFIGRVREVFDHEVARSLLARFEVVCTHK